MNFSISEEHLKSNYNYFLLSATLFSVLFTFFFVSFSTFFFLTNWVLLGWVKGKQNLILRYLVRIVPSSPGVMCDSCDRIRIQESVYIDRNTCLVNVAVLHVFVCKLIVR
jgi:hypothetical protein